MTLTNVLLAVLSTLLGANLLVSWSSPAPAHAQRTLEYAVVRMTTRDVHIDPEVDFQNWVNGYARNGWQLVPVTGPNSATIFVR